VGEDAPRAEGQPRHRLDGTRLRRWGRGIPPMHIASVAR
jgi:hypothetical protein